MEMFHNKGTSYGTYGTARVFHNSERVMQQSTFKGDLVFDPFAGSGTLGKSAIEMERFFFLTEKKEEYIERIRNNISYGNVLFGENFKPRIMGLEDFIMEAKK